MKRKIFLEIFLKALGAVEIKWENSTAEKIYGTVIYDETNPEESQDFVWHMREEKVPSEKARKVIQFIIDNNLIENDKIIKPTTELNLDFIEQHEREKVFAELFEIRVRMLNNGVETDAYFIHE